MLKKLNAFRIISIIFAVMVIFSASYFLVNSYSKEVSPSYTQLFLGCMFLFWSLSEFKEKRTLMGILNLIFSLFIFSVFVMTL